MSLTLSIGILPPSISDQVAHIIGEEKAKHFDELNNSITKLQLAGHMSESTANRHRERLGQSVKKAVELAQSEAEGRTA